MTDTTTTGASAKAKREQAALRDWINAAGQPVDPGKEGEATGLRYTHLATARRLDPAFNAESSVPHPDAVFERQFGNPGSIETMLSIFGGMTLAGNIVNTLINGPKGDPTCNPIPDIAARFEELDKGVWADRSGGVGGVRYVPETLAAVIAQVKGESDPSPYLAKMATKVSQQNGATVANDAKGAISYGAYAMRNPRVKEAYELATGKTGTDLNTL